MRGGRATRSVRWVAVVSIAATLSVGIARVASAQACDEGIFTSTIQAPAGASVRMTRSAPALIFGGTAWALEACFVLAQKSPAVAPISATIDFRPPGFPAPFYLLGGATLHSVGGLPATCQVLPDQLHLVLSSAGPLPPNAISQECCVFARHPSSPTCDQLPSEPDEVHVQIDTPGQPSFLTGVAVLDRGATVLGGGGGGTSSGGCGLTGIEFLGVPFALLALRARSGRREGGAS